jgi:hypothetical protein
MTDIERAGERVRVAINSMPSMEFSHLMDAFNGASNRLASRACETLAAAALAGVEPASPMTPEVKAVLDAVVTWFEAVEPAEVNFTMNLLWGAVKAHRSKCPLRGMS